MPETIDKAVPATYSLPGSLKRRVKEEAKIRQEHESWVVKSALRLWFEERGKSRPDSGVVEAAS